MTKPPRRLRLFIVTLFAFLSLSALFAPQPAHAYTFTQPTVIGPNGDVCPGTGLTRRLVPCIESTVLYAANQMLSSISALMASTVAVCCTLAVVLWGMLVVTQRPGVLKEGGFVLAVKIGAVIIFTSNFGASYFDPQNTQGGFFGMLLSCMDYMMGVVTAYVTNLTSFSSNATCVVVKGEVPQYLVWDTIDCMLEILIGGIFSANSLLYGLVGFFLTCGLSGIMGFFGASQLFGTLGLFIAVIGVYLIVQLVLCIARAVYIVISCYLSFGLMVIISPFMVPLILFHVTEDYFKKWLRLTASYMVQPMIILAFLGMLIAAYDTVVYSGPNSLYRAIAGSAVGPTSPPTINPGFQIGSWLLGGATTLSPCGQTHAGYYCLGILGGQAIQIDPRRVRQVFNPPTPVNGGEFGQVGQISSLPAGAWSNIFRTLGLGQDIDPTTGLPDTRFFRVGMTVPTLDFGQLAAFNGYSVTDYIINLLMSALMALITVYIFKHLLEALPLISSGITGGVDVRNALGTINNISQQLGTGIGQ